MCKKVNFEIQWSVTPPKCTRPSIKLAQYVVYVLAHLRLSENKEELSPH